MWNESIFNTTISSKLRAFFLEMLLNILLQYLQHSKNWPSIMIGFHKSDKKQYVFFAAPSKLKRIIMIILVQLMYVKYGNILYALDRYGSHDKENFIGIIRMLCDGDNTYERITHNLARYEYISRESDETFIKPRPK